MLPNIYLFLPLIILSLMPFSSDGFSKKGREYTILLEYLYNLIMKVYQHLTKSDIGLVEYLFVHSFTQ